MPFLTHNAWIDDLSLLMVLLGSGLVVVLNNQDLLLCARPLVHLLLVVHCSDTSSRNDQKSTKNLASLVAPAKSFVSAAGSISSDMACNNTYWTCKPSEPPLMQPDAQVHFIDHL